ncbi:MAG: cysteine--tRNA ligase [Patescibacteria group bacterium]
MNLYNSLTRKVEEFKPQNPNRVTMYTCGPTVYGPSHLGHARTYINFDLLKRVLEFNGYTVEHVLNFTDVHDSMIEEAQNRKVSIKDLAAEYIQHFYLDFEKLNVEPASAYPQVTEHIPEIIKMISELVKKGFAYEKDGSVYYDVSQFKDYGKLSGRKLAEARTGTRVAADKYEREEVADFALWKKAAEGEEDVGAVWDSPWGKGRPGWHIECSVMSRIHLGDTLDIHGGGMDLKFPHHENEIAQSEAATGKKFANLWVHVGTLLIEGQKMGKSTGNIIDFDTLVQKEFDPLAFRYLCLTTHYRGELNFTWAGLEAAAIALEKLYDELANWDVPGRVGCAEYENKFDGLINDDLNLPEAVALMWQLVKDRRMPTSARMKTILQMDRVLGLKLGEVEAVAVPEEVRDLVKEREVARREDNWTRADELRDRIAQFGFAVEDTGKGPVVKRSG